MTTVYNKKLRPNLVSKMNNDRCEDRSHKPESNNNEEKPEYLSPAPILHHLDRNLMTSDSLNPPPLRERDLEEQLLIEALENINEKNFLEESINLHFSELPNTKDLDSLERQVFEDLKFFDNIEGIEEMNKSSALTEETVPRKAPCRRRPDKVIHDCKDCGKVFMDVTYLRAHADSHKPQLTCQTCGKVCRTAAQMARHLKSHGVKDPTESRSGSCKISSFTCRSCGANYGNKSELVKHQKTEHNLFKNIQRNKDNTRMRSKTGSHSSALSKSHR